MRTNRSVYFIIAFLLLMLLMLAVGGCRRSPEQRAEHAVRHLVSTLKLDDAQKAKLEKMKDEFLAKRPEMMKTREESMADLKEMMLSPQIDPAKLDARRQKVQTQADDLIRFVFAKFAELHDMLTPEQRIKLTEEIEQHAHRAHHW